MPGTLRGDVQMNLGNRPAGVELFKRRRWPWCAELSGVKFIVPSCAESAMVKQPACAAAINSSGFVPLPFSKRVTKE